MSCHKSLTPRNPFSFTFFILLFCLNLSIVNSIGESWTCELLNVTVSQRWIGNSLEETPESKAIQTSLQDTVDLTTVGSDHWSCFETETATGILGTPGGDTSEFLLALSVLFKDSPLITYNESAPSTNNTSEVNTSSLSTSSSASVSPSALESLYTELYNNSVSLLSNFSGFPNVSNVLSSDLFASQLDNGTLSPSVLENGLNVSSFLSDVLPLFNVSLNSTDSSQFPSSLYNSNSDLPSSVDSSVVDNSSILPNSSSFWNYTELNSSSVSVNSSSYWNYTELNSSSVNSSSYWNYTELYSSISNMTLNYTQTATGNVSVPPPVPTNLSAILNPPLFKRVHEIFDAFMKANTSSSRRFYYHSDFDIVERLRTRFGLRNKEIFYDLLTPEQQREAFSLVIQPENIGCKHLLQILQNPTVYQTPTIITQTFIQVLHNYLWNHNNGTYFSRFYVDLSKRTHPVEVAHLNVTVSIVAHPEKDTSYDHSETTANPCQFVQATVPTLIGNDSYYVVHTQGISSFRKQLAEYTASLPEAKLTQQQTYNRLEELANIQWALSQSKLGPNLKTFDVVIYTQNRTGDVVEMTWLFVGIGIIGAALLSYLAYFFWKRRRDAADATRLFDDEETPNEKYPIRVENVSYSNPKN